MSVALALFGKLCDVGNALAYVRDTQEPASDTWTALTCILLSLDAAIDTLVHSNGLGGSDDGLTPAPADDLPLCPVCAPPMYAVQVGHNIYALPCFHWLYQGGGATMPKGQTTRLRVTLTPEDRRILTSWCRSTTIAWGLAQRARTILLMAEGRRIKEIAATVGTTRRFVYKWTARFLVQGVDGLWDLPRPGAGHTARRSHAAPRPRGAGCLTCAPTTESGRTVCGVWQTPARVSTSDGTWPN